MIDVLKPLLCTLDNRYLGFALGFIYLFIYVLLYLLSIMHIYIISSHTLGDRWLSGLDSLHGAKSNLFIYLFTLFIHETIHIDLLWATDDCQTLIGSLSWTMYSLLCASMNESNLFNFLNLFLKLYMYSYIGNQWLTGFGYLSPTTC